MITSSPGSSSGETSVVFPATAGALGDSWVPDGAGAASGSAAGMSLPVNLLARRRPSSGGPWATTFPSGATTRQPLSSISSAPLSPGDRTRIVDAVGRSMRASGNAAGGSAPAVVLGWPARPPIAW